MPTTRSLVAFLLTIAAVALATRPVRAEPRAFDVFTFEPPIGWRVEEKPTSVEYVVVDNVAGTWCMLGVYASRPSGPDAAADYRAEWKELVQKSFDARSAPAPTRGTTASGLAFFRGDADVKASTGPAWVELAVLLAGGRTTSILAAASSKAVLEARRREIRGLVDEVHMAGAPGAAAVGGPPTETAAPVEVTSRPAPGQSAGWRGGGVIGVWMGMVAPTFGGSYAPEPRWRVFFADGEVFMDLPDAGLQSFDRAASKAGPRRGYWGTYRMTGTKGLAERPGEKYGTKIEVKGPDKLELDGTVFLRSADVSGLRLAGAWTSYADAASPELDRLPVGRRPVIHFTREGRFVDDGLFATFLKTYGSADAGELDAPGEGTYEVADFTLTLRYADGRVRREAISGFLGANPSTTNDIVAIRRGLLHKRPRG